MIDYKGWVQLTDEQMSLFYSGTYESMEFRDNEYIMAGNEVYKWKNNSPHRCEYPVIDTGWGGQIKPLDIFQFAAMDMLQDRNTTVKIIRGVYGGGKDHLMLNQALSLVERGDFEKIVFTRPNVTLANVPQIGFLPNGIDEKLAWTLAPLYDKVGGEDGVERLIRSKQLEMVPLLFIRGRSFENSIVYVTEAQNIDSEIAKVLLSRIGNGSEIWLNGDNHQTDNRVFDKNNGLTLMVDRLTGNELFSYVYLPNTHRSKTANLANLLD